MEEYYEYENHRDSRVDHMDRGINIRMRSVEELGTRAGDDVFHG